MGQLLKLGGGKKHHLIMSLFFTDLCQSWLASDAPQVWIITSNSVKPNKRKHDLVMVTGNLEDPEHDVSLPRFPGFVAEPLFASSAQNCNCWVKPLLLSLSKQKVRRYYPIKIDAYPLDTARSIQTYRVECLLLDWIIG